MTIQNNARRFFMQADNGGGTGNGNGGTTVEGDEGKKNDPGEDLAKAKKSKSESAGDDPASKEKKRIAELEARIKEHDDELKKYKEKEKAEADKKKSDDERIAQRDSEIATLKRQNLIERVRREGGYQAKVFDNVKPDGETEAEIKAAFDSHKEALDDYLKSNGQETRPGQGGSTKDGGKPDGKRETRSNLTFLEQAGIVKTKGAV